MPNVFISYRRDDVAANARLIYERLKAWFGKGRVFMDVEDIELGDDWEKVLDGRIERCDTLLAVIGPRWLRPFDPKSAQSAEAARDFVRWEIREALARRKRVIPVLVDGSVLPAEAELPPDVAPLARLQVQRVGHATLDKDVETLFETVSGEGRTIDIRTRLQELLRMGRASIVVMALVGILVISFAWANVFDLVGLDTRTASFTMALGDAVFEPPLRDDLLLIGIKPRPDEVNALAPARRLEYARLIDLLAAAGATTVAFDIRLAAPSAFDEALAQSVRTAQARGTEVAFGFRKLAGVEPEMLGALAAAHPGLTCVGAKLDEAVFGTVALRRDDRMYASLPLVAAFAPTAIDPPPPSTNELQIQDRAGKRSWVPFSLRQPVEQADANCPARAPGAEMERLLMRLSHRERLREPVRRVDLDAVLGGSVEPGRFARKHVLVGAEHPLDMLETRLDFAGRRYGFEFHADVLNALLGGQAVRPVPFLGQWSTTLFAIALAIGYRLWRLNSPRWWDSLVLLAGCLSIVAMTTLLYAKFSLLADGLYNIVAFVVTWLALSILKSRRSHEMRVAA